MSQKGGAGTGEEGREDAAESAKYAPSEKGYENQSGDAKEEILSAGDPKDGCGVVS